MRPRHVVLALGLAGSLALLGFGDSGAPFAPATVPMPGRAAPHAAHASPQQLPWVMRVLPRDELVGDVGVANDGAFRRQSWNPPPRDEETQAPVEAPPPEAPALPFRYIGKALGAGGWEVYLAEGDAVHVARPDDVIGGAYRVTRIAPPSMTLLYLPLNLEQAIDIGASE